MTPVDRLDKSSLNSTGNSDQCVRSGVARAGRYVVGIAFIALSILGRTVCCGINIDLGTWHSGRQIG